MCFFFHHSFIYSVNIFCMPDFVFWAEDTAVSTADHRTEILD